MLRYLLRETRKYYVFNCSALLVSIESFRCFELFRNLCVSWSPTVSEAKCDGIPWTLWRGSIKTEGGKGWNFLETACGIHIHLHNAVRYRHQQIMYCNRLVLRTYVLFHVPAWETNCTGQLEMRNELYRPAGRLDNSCPHAAKAYAIFRTATPSNVCYSTTDSLADDLIIFWCHNARAFS